MISTEPKIKSIIKAAFTIIIGLSISSCSILRKATLTENEIELNNNNLTLINGTYERNTYRDGTKGLFWYFYKDSFQGDQVSLRAIDNKHIKVSMLNGSDTILSKTLKGKIKDGHFTFKRRIVIYPLLIGNVYRDSKVRICLLKNGNLSVDTKTILYGHIMIFPVADGSKEYEFEQLRR